MLVFVKGPLETLNYFIECMLELEDYDRIVLDIMSKSFWEDLEKAADKFNQETIVILFNNAGLEIEFSNGKNIWEEKGVKLYNILVDHPIWYKRYLNKPISNMNIIVIDKSHKKFINNYFPDVKAVYYLPHGGIENKKKVPYRQREIDVLYIGSCQENVDEFPAIDYLPESGGELYAYIHEKLYNNTLLEVEDALQLYLEEKQIHLDREKIIEVIFYLHCTVELIIKRTYKFNAIKLLAENNISVEIYGDNWEEMEEAYPDLVKVHERVTSQECIDLITNSKVVLNIMPWFKDGSHERIYNTMLNGAVCVSDKSKYLEDKFVHGKNIVFFNYNDLNGLPEDIKYLLDNYAVAEEIAENGYLRVLLSTWKDRLLNIINEDFEENFI